MAENRQYYYLKLKEGFFDSEEIRILESMKDGYIYSNILLKLYLRSLRNEGRLMYRNVIPYTPEVLATLTGHQVGVIEKALKVFRELELIEILNNGAIYMMDIQNFIGQSSTEADRQRAYYNRIKADKNSIAEIPEDKKIEIGVADAPDVPAEPKTKKKESSYTTDFEEFWKAYPRKADKGQAYKKYCARLHDGFSPKELLQAAVNYAADCRKNRTEEKYIKHGKTFLGDSTPFIDYISKKAARDVKELTDDSNPFRT